MAPELKDYTAQTLPAYQAQANEAAATSAQNRAAFNEYAAAGGLNSGTGGQAQLAMNNARQNNLTAIRTNQANAVSDAELALAKLMADHTDQNGNVVKGLSYQ
jgi:hypothetical protein